MLAVLHEAVVDLLFAAHLLCVNVAAGGPLICAWLEWREGRGDRVVARAADFLARAALTTFIVGAALGVALIFAVWTPEQRQAIMDALSGKVYWGLAEIAFFLVTAGGYLLWRRRAAAGKAERIARGALAAIAGTNLLYHFPALFVIITRVAYQARPTDDVIDAAGFRALLAEPEVLSQCVHYWLASLAVAGAALLAFPLWDRRRRDNGASEPGDDPGRAAIWGARLALAVTLAQIPVGLWALTSLSAPYSVRLMGGNLAASGLFLAALAAALGLLHQLAAVALGETQRRRLVWSLGLMALTVTLMAAMLRQSRPDRSSRLESAGATGARRLTIEI